MIHPEDYEVVRSPESRHVVRPRTFRWTYEDFKQTMTGDRLKKPNEFNSTERVTKRDMEFTHGGVYWPTVNGSMVALPYDSPEFRQEEWT